VRALEQAERLALVHGGASWTYGDLLDRSASLAATLLNGRHDLHGARVLLIAPPGVDAVAGLWAIWRAGGIAVPLSPAQPAIEWEYAACDSQASFALAARDLVDALEPVALAAHLHVLPVDGRGRSGPLPDIDPDRDALILYTSGTTGRPKGAVFTHAQVQAQVEALVEAWGWEPDDRLLHVLPLNHTHGLIVALSCALWTGAACEMLDRFDAGVVWTRLASGEVSVFMAVPTMYRRLVAARDAAPHDVRVVWSEGVGRVRLMTSGSAPLPVDLFEKWRQVAGASLLERYGLTEAGMVLSNPLRGERLRGHVGTPLPGVEVRLVDDTGHDVAEGESGEILVKSPGVFRGYWDNPAATQAAFDADGWLKTGDVGEWSQGMVRLLGRLSVDIIKSGGEKVSALEVEEALRAHPAVLDCAVVGVPDEEWGEVVSVTVVPRAGAEPSLEALREWARPLLSAYKLPRKLSLVDELPRNAMGKVIKTGIRG
jgi:malonyl-CoA/methylmalonyl-CoA synthetase